MSNEELRRYGMNRAQLRQGSGTWVGNEHFDQPLGCSEFVIYITPNKRPKGYEVLRALLQGQGCEVGLSAEAPLLPGKGYRAIKVTASGGILPEEGLLEAHRWAHRRNYLHSFFKPLGVSWR